MRPSQSNPVLRYVRNLAAAEYGRDLADRELLERFNDQCEEAAFTALVHRHGPMVLRVSRAILQNEQDAEDAFQATFLVLSQKVASLQPHQSLCGWLYGVAYRIAQKARIDSARRRKYESRAAGSGQVTDPLAHVTLREAQQVLDEELARLPDKFRAPVVLCYLEGLTRDEAAYRLGWTPSTLKSRLEQARERLRVRLASRGMALSGVLVVSLFGSATVSSAVPSVLLNSTVKAATCVAVGRAAITVVSTKVAALTKGGSKAMITSKLTVIAGILLLIGALTSGARILIGRGLAVEPEQSTAHKKANQQGQPKASTEGSQKADSGKAAWREILTMKHERAITALACSADWSAAGDEGGKLFAWDTKTGKNRTPNIGGGTTIDRLQFTADEKDQYTPDGKSLYVIWGGRKGIARYFVKDKKFEGGHGFGGGGYLGVSADAEISLELFRQGKGVNLRRNAYEFRMGKFFVRPNYDPNHFETVEYKAKVSHALVSADDKWLAVATEDGTLHIHDRASLQETHTIATGKEAVVIKDVQFSADGQRIAVARDDALAKVYDTAKGEEVATLKGGHSGIVFAVAFSPDGKKVVTGGDDNTARIWDAATGKALATLKGHTDSVRCVAFDPRGEILVTGSADKTVKLWRAGAVRVKADVKKEVTDFEGTWVVVSAESNGKKGPKEVLQGMTITFEGGAFTMKEAGKDRIIKGSFKINSSKTPTEYDASAVLGGKKYSTVGIYEFDGATLRICYTPEGGKRPKEFSTKGGTDEHPMFLTVYKRQNEKKGA
jgi:RNA polymerase sigma factor (sigma-70 family)